MVYVALLVFIIGTVWQSVRIFLGFKYSLKTVVGPEKKPKFWGAATDAFLFPGVLKSHPLHWVFLIVLHAALLLLTLGHFELIGEIGFLQVVRHEIFLGRGLIGIILLIVLLFFLFRRFHSPVREISEAGDYYILLLLLIVVFLGSQLHLARCLFSYDTIDVEAYREYLGSVFTLAPSLPEVFQDDSVGHSLVLVLHVFFANLFLIYFPFSKMVHSLLAFPLARLRRR